MNKKGNCLGNMTSLCELNQDSNQFFIRYTNVSVTAVDRVAFDVWEIIKHKEGQACHSIGVYNKSISQYTVKENNKGLRK